MYKGQLEGFPQEVVEKMLDEQVKQGNKRDVSVFEKANVTGCDYGGIDWQDTEYGYYFWQRVIGTKDFDLFFEKYPKKQMFKRGDKILVWDMYRETPEERIAITDVDGAIYPVICVAIEDEDNFINGKKFSIVQWKYWKPIPQEQVVELTMDEIAEKFGVDVNQLKIK